MLQPCKCKTLASIPKSSGIVRASGCCPPRDSWSFLCFRVHESVQGQVSVVLSRRAHKGSTQQILSDWTSQISKPAWIQFDIIAISRWNHSDEVFKYFPTMYLQCIYTIPTSSTAQGGGGSFKNKKPIGEVGCCESGMAERSHCWIERCLISLTLSLSFSDYLPTYLSIFYVSIYLSI